MDLDRLEQLFRAALLHAPAERAAFLDAACADDPELRRELDSLLRADAEADAEAFLEDDTSSLIALVQKHAAQPSVPIPRRPPDLQGQHVGPYLILRQLGQGGMGDVYLAVREHPFKRYVALKIIRRGMDSGEIIARFEMERQILAALDHPHIARLLDGGITEDGRPYFAMEYVEGRPVTTYCDEHRLSIGDRLRLFRDVCAAVQHAHQNLVIHRDLKPSNILVTERGTVKLLDFGIAKLLNPTLSPVPMPVTRTELRVMTPEYASPEQIRGETLSTASDVYTLGVLLYELLTGQRPYRLAGCSTPEVLRIVCEEEPLRPSEKIMHPEGAADGDGTTPSSGKAAITPQQASAARGTTPDRLQRHLKGDLDNIVMMALRKEPERRYASAERLSQDLERHGAGLPVTARPSTWGYRVRKFVQRHRTGVVAAILVLMSLLGGLGAALWQANKAGQERDRAEQALAQSEAVTTFLMRLFEANDPMERKSTEITARELLERGIARAEELSHQPIVQAQMFDVIGQVYESLGQYDPAERLIRRGLALRRAQFGEEHPDVAESLTSLGWVLMHRGRYTEAETLFRQALAIERELLPDPHPSTIRTLMGLAHLLPYLGKLEEGEAADREVLAMRRALLGDEHPLVANSMMNLAAMLRSRGSYGEAEALFREALALHLRISGEEHTNVAWNLFQLALLLQMQENYEEAEALYRRAIDVQRRAEGEGHPHLGSFKLQLALLLHAQGRNEEAEPLLREALALKQATLGDHPDVAGAQFWLARFLRDKGAYAEADTVLEETLAMYRRLIGPDHQEIAHVIAEQARLLADRGQFPEAQARFERALAMYQKVNGPLHHHVAGILTELARLHRRLDEPEEAGRLYREALAIHEALDTAHLPDVQRLYGEVADFYEARGETEQAAQYRAQARIPAAGADSLRR